MERTITHFPIVIKVKCVFFHIFLSFKKKEGENKYHVFPFYYICPKKIKLLMQP